MFGDRSGLRLVKICRRIAITRSALVLVSNLTLERILQNLHWRPTEDTVGSGFSITVPLTFVSLLETSHEQNVYQAFMMKLFSKILFSRINYKRLSLYVYAHHPYPFMRSILHVTFCLHFRNR